MRSSPAQNARPAPVKTMARVPSSALASSKARATSSMSWRFMALSRSGRLSANVRTPSSPSSLQDGLVGRRFADTPANLSVAVVLVPTLDELLRRPGRRPAGRHLVLRFRTRRPHLRRGRPAGRRTSPPDWPASASGAASWCRCCMPNGPDIVVTWFALDRLGAVADAAQHRLPRRRRSTPCAEPHRRRAVVVDAALTDVGRSQCVTELPTLRTAVVFGGDAGPAPSSPALDDRPRCPAGRVGTRRAARRRRTAMTDPAMVHVHLRARPGRRRAACSRTATPSARPSS